VARSSDRRSTLALVLLALLAEEPMHPYRMQQMIKQRGKDKIANVAARNSVYQTIDRLLRAELITVRETSRDERRPERTVYELTGAGEDALRAWTSGMLSAPAREFPEFPAALAFLAILEPAEVGRLLAARRREVELRLAAVTGQAPPGLPRLFLIEDEYRAAMMRAELAWLAAVVDDLATGRLTWDEELIRKTLEAFVGARETTNGGITTRARTSSSRARGL
jgi:DNA-binding PadR family transcriptional regulator